MDRRYRVRLAICKHNGVYNRKTLDVWIDDEYGVSDGEIWEAAHDRYMIDSAAIYNEGIANSIVAIGLIEYTDLGYVEERDG